MDTAQTIRREFAAGTIASAASVPQGGNVVIISTHSSWGQLTLPQDVGDQAARQTAREAGRRAVRKYGDTLSKLAD